MAFPIRASVPGTADLDEELLVYSPGYGSVISLNASARKIWQECEGNLNVEQICQKIAGELGVDEKALRPDIELGLKQLEDAKLITWKQPD